MMGAGWIVSLIVGGLWIIIILAIIIPFDRKHIVRENRKINYRKTTIYLRWNVFDTLIFVLGIYTIVCVQALNMLISRGEDVTSPYVQFFTNQSQVWVIIIVIYSFVRISSTLKSIKAHLEDELDDDK
ncbi:group-specific protein [Metasolibacillus fluoroglycofenilyticus]|uniref:group-specific protein n=1 Tax=Metasolibacillus fluoroglycofenilyticus TaxID=1239396 RepID=UPI001F40B029|nr:group-specific protein [Metasolibacillus fluoroglycofenilyticus]